VIKLTRHQALALMDWAALPLVAPELVPFKQKLQAAIDELNRIKDKRGECPSCAQTQYLGWERVWLQKLNQALNSHDHMQEVAKQFLSTNYEDVARQHMERRLKAAAESKATQKLGQE